MSSVCETFSPREHIPLHISSYHPQGQRRNKSNDEERGGGGRASRRRVERLQAALRGGREEEKGGMKERVPNTSEPFYKVNKMEAATAYPRLNATSYFESSSNASLLVSPLAVSLPSSSAPLQTGCTDVIAPSLPALPRLFFFFSHRGKRKAIPPGKGGPSRFEFCERTASGIV